MDRRSNTCFSCTPPQTGNLNHNWKGGKTRHKAGYVMIKALDHPRSKSNSGYVFEHILVMEEHIGRHLIPGENVHHKNGVKDDNRIENLELWTRPQPSGARARDLVEYAQDIIQLYGDLYASNKL